jgi:ABC-type proline/glycine betaine transport system ATPase subunit
MLINIKHNILGVPIVRLKTKQQKVNELLNMFKLPSVDYTKGYQAKPRPELTGGSASGKDAAGLQAINELRRWYRRATV